MSKDFVLPPRRRFTSREKRRNAKVVWTLVAYRQPWASEHGLRMVHELERARRGDALVGGAFSFGRAGGWFRNRSIFDELADSVLPAWRLACGTSRRRESAEIPCMFPRERSDDGKSGCDGRRLDDPGWPEFFFMRLTLLRSSFSWRVRLLKRGVRMGLIFSCYVFANGLDVKRRRTWLKNCWNERWIWEVFLPFAHHGRELESEQRTISLMSFVGLHVSASDEIFSELEMLVGRHATDGSCGGDVIFLEVGEVLKGNVDFENGRLFGHKHKRGYFPLLFRCTTSGCNVARKACVIWALIAKRMGQGRIIARMVWEEEKDENVFDTKEKIWASTTICDEERLVHSFSHIDIVFSIEWVLFCPSLLLLLAAC